MRRWVKRSLIITAITALPIGFVAGCIITDNAKHHEFFQERELIRMMMEATRAIDTRRTHPNTVRTDVLLSRVPLGTEQTEAIQMLSLEKFACQKRDDPPFPRKNVFDCLPVEKPWSVGRWNIQLEFNDEQRLKTASVWVSK